MGSRGRDTTAFQKKTPKVHRDITALGKFPRAGGAGPAPSRSAQTRHGSAQGKPAAGPASSSPVPKFQGSGAPCPPSSGAGGSHSRGQLTPRGPSPEKHSPACSCPLQCQLTNLPTQLDTLLPAPQPQAAGPLCTGPRVGRPRTPGSQGGASRQGPGPVPGPVPSWPLPAPPAQVPL